MNINLINSWKKIGLGFLLILCFMFLVLPKTVSAEETNTWNPDGDSYVISTAADLDAFRSSISSEKTYEGITITLGKSIDVKGTSWTALNTEKTDMFKGVFDGKSFTISGFDDKNCGLMYYVNGEIANLNLSFDVEDVERSYGGLISNRLYKNGTVSNCSVSGSIQGSSSIAGMVRTSSSGGTVKDCFSSVNIETVKNAYGLLGFAGDGSVTQNLYTCGTLVGKTVYAVAKFRNTTATNCYYLDSINVTTGVTNAAGTAKTADELKTQSTYDGWDFDTVWQIDPAVNDGYPTLRQGKEATVKQTVQLKAIITVEDKVVPAEGTASLTSNPRDLDSYLVPDFTVELVPMDGQFDPTIIDTYHVKLEKRNPEKYKTTNFFTGQEVSNMVIDEIKAMSFARDVMKLVSDANDLYNFEVFADNGLLLAYEANTPSFTFNGDTEPPTEAEKTQILADVEASINKQMDQCFPADTEILSIDSWAIFTAARAGYNPYEGFYDDLYKMYEDKYQNATSFTADDTAKDVLAISAMGFDPRDVADNNLIEIMKTNRGTSWFSAQVLNFAINSYNYEPGWGTSSIHKLAADAVANVSGEHDTGSPDGGIDMYIMQFQPIAAYYDPNATESDEFYDVKVAMETVFLPYLSNMQGYTGDFYSGMIYANPWSTAQAHIMLGMSSTDIFDPMFIKNGNTLLSKLIGNIGFGADRSQCARGYEAMVRAAKGENQIFDCTDVTNSTVVVNNAIAALPAVDTITSDTKDATQIALDAVDTLIGSLTLSETQTNSMDMTKYNAVKTKLSEMIPSDDEKAAQLVSDKITNLPVIDQLALDNEGVVIEVRAAFDQLTDDQKKLVNEENQKKLTDAEAKIIAMKAAAGLEENQAAAKKVTDQIVVLPEANSLTLTDKTAVTAAREAYTALTDTQKILVTNLTRLTIAETKIIELEKTETDQVAAKKVTDQINDLGNITKWEEKVSIDLARAEYNKLTVDQKALVTVDTLNSLKAAEATVEKLKPIIGSITIDVERFTIGQGFYVDPQMLNIKEGETARQAIEELLGVKNLVGDVGYLRAIKGADTGTATIPQYIVDELGGSDSATANAYGQGYDGSTLGEFDYSSYSGWMYFVNNNTPSVGMDSYTLKNGDVLRLAFTYWGTGADVTGLEYGTNKVLVSIANKDSLIKVIAKVNENTAYFGDTAISEAYATAMTIVQDMTVSQKTTDDANTVLNQAISDYKPDSPTDNTKIAKVVIDQIAGLPAVDQLVITDKADVEAARIAYDALTIDQKDLVNNLDALVAAEAKIAELVDSEITEADKAAAKVVVDQIAALPAADQLALGNKADVVAVRIGYNTLTEIQKSLVSNLDALVAVEAKIAELETITPPVTDEATGIEIVGLPESIEKLIIENDIDNEEIKKAAEEAAATAGLKDVSVITLQSIKPDMIPEALEAFNNDQTSYVTVTLPIPEDKQGLENYRIYHLKDNGAIEWLIPVLSEDGKSLVFKVNSFSTFGIVNATESSDPVEGETPVLTYQTHVQNDGWQEEKADSELSGTEARSLRLEGIKINLDKKDYDLGIAYQTQIENIGWQEEKVDGELSGTEGMSYRLEGIKIHLTGADADQFDIYYHVHAQNYGWLDWTKNGASAGTEGLSLRLEAIEITLVEKGSDAPGKTEQSFVTGNMHINYQTQIQNIGWQSLRADGTMSGTKGQSLRLEGIKINLDNAGYDVGISYQTHVQDIGWQDLRENGDMSGTEGESKRLEGIRMSLTGADAGLCDVYYQVHTQNIGWMNWAKNGESSGSEGFAYRLEGIRVVVVPKGSPAPELEVATSDEAFMSNN